MEKLCESTSTILPLPSSPHWAPTITAVLPRFTSIAHSSPAGFSRDQKNNPGKSGRESLLLRDFNREKPIGPSGKLPECQDCQNAELKVSASDMGAALMNCLPSKGTDA